MANMFIKVRYQIKSSGTVCCRIDNGKGAECTTCIHKNGLVSCTCPARVSECKHVKHLRACEAARQPQQQPQEVETQQEAQQAAPIAETPKDSTPTLARALGSVSAPKVSTAEQSLSLGFLMRGQRVGGMLASMGR